MRGRTWCGLAVGALLVLGGCSDRAPEGATPAGKPPVAVEVATVAAADLEESIAVVGVLSPKVAADLRSEVTAVVEEVLVSEWVPVQKGQVLARLSPRDAEATLEAARAALAQAEAAAARAERELARAERLKASGLLTQQGLDEARSAHEAAQAARDSAQAQLRLAEAHLAKTVIRAPFEGVVAYRGVNVGDRVENMGGGVPMFRIVDTRVLQLAVTVPSSLSARVRVGQPLTFRVDALPGKVFTGVVMYINPTVDEASRAVKVTADVANREGGLRGGMFAEGKIVTGVRRGVLQVPRAALLSWDVESNRGEVLVVVGNSAERRRVELGTAAGELVEVRAGVTAGEQVITRGAFQVRPGEPVRIVGPAGV
jgi:membrane fusion protein (multidrug efflux system)